jgi:hypothetical protein
MPYNFLSLVNDVAVEVNEVVLTEANFTSATGVYSQIKNAVNSAIRQINQEAFEWPFYHQTREVVLAVDQVIIPYNSLTESINFDSVRIKGELALNNQSRLLVKMDYEEYLSKYVDAEFNPTNYSDIPRYVFRKPNLTFGIHPPAKEAYTLRYDSYDIPVDMVSFDDVPLIPEQFRYTIKDGALFYVFMFRGDPESAVAIKGVFENGIKTMRTLYQNRYEYVRSGFIER